MEDEIFRQYQSSTLEHNSNPVSIKAKISVKSVNRSNPKNP